jgi:hypothetical protein
LTGHSRFWNATFASKGNCPDINTNDAASVQGEKWGNDIGLVTLLLKYETALRRRRFRVLIAVHEAARRKCDLRDPEREQIVRNGPTHDECRGRAT